MADELKALYLLNESIKNKVLAIYDKLRGKTKQKKT